MPLYRIDHDAMPGETFAPAVARTLAALHGHDEDRVRSLEAQVPPIPTATFCILEAPDAASAHRLHREVHGVSGDEIVARRVPSRPHEAETGPAIRRTWPARRP